MGAPYIYDNSGLRVNHSTATSKATSSSRGDCLVSMHKKHRHRIHLEINVEPFLRIFTVTHFHEVTCMVTPGVSACFVCKRTKPIFMECNVCESTLDT